MSKLVFKYGSMSAGKSLKLLSEVYDLSKTEMDIEVLLLKPDIDTRTETTIKSRLGVEAECQLIHKDTDLYALCMEKDFVFIDECQFLTKEQVDTLRKVSYYGVNIICFGLLTTFQRKLFEGSQRLIEVADEVIELEGRCERCGAKATVNMRLVNGKLVLEGEEISIGDEEYMAVCYDCFRMYEKHGRD